MPDVIIIEKLELGAHIGVTEEERAEPQRLTVSLTLEPTRGLADLRDRVNKTIDYSAVCLAVQKLGYARPRNLIETLAEEIATLLLRRFPVNRVVVELHKYILADTEHVGVRIERASSADTGVSYIR